MPYELKVHISPLTPHSAVIAVAVMRVSEHTELKVIHDHGSQFTNPCVLSMIMLVSYSVCVAIMTSNAV